MSPASMLVRLHDVAFPLLVSAAEWCPFEQEPTYGFLLKGEEAPQNEGGKETGRGASVVYVHPRLPAASAGLLPGDVMMRVNERDVTDQRAEEIMQLVRRLTVARIQPLQLEILRDGERRLVTMWAVPACQFSVQLIESDLINGISDGRQVGVTTGAVRFFRSNDELGWVLAHEIAHNVLSHVQSAKLRAMLNAFLGATVGASAVASPSPPQKSLEAQADYVGSYIMARAGYDLRAIQRVWDRLGTIQSQERELGRKMDETHPTTTERLAAFKETLNEIEERRARGESLQPVLEHAQ
jgi:predicted Zn-dependent protease